MIFLSTLSLRRATAGWAAKGGTCCDFYPRSPCGERPNTSPGPNSMTPISIHALLAESDGGLGRQGRDLLRFLSTLSLRRATNVGFPIAAFLLNFYPRSPCGERLSLAGLIGIDADFYPRSPCGERPITYYPHMRHAVFLSTLSLRRATARPTANTGATKFLSTLSLRRATQGESSKKKGRANFYPRSPCGERLSERVPLAELTSISIHALLAESDHISFNSQQWHLTFLSTLSLRRATASNRTEQPTQRISIHALLAESDVSIHFCAPP